MRNTKGSITPRQDTIHEAPTKVKPDIAAANKEEPDIDSVKAQPQLQPEDSYKVKSMKSYLNSLVESDNNDTNSLGVYLKPAMKFSHDLTLKDMDTIFEDVENISECLSVA
ncbi:hypothetical protein BGZ76_005916, partial [Entomortierella beljakovae]